MPTYKRPEFDASLPPTRVTKRMKDAIIQIAQKEGKSIGEIQRQAISFFLSANSTNCKVESTK